MKTYRKTQVFHTFEPWMVRNHEKSRKIMKNHEKSRQIMKLHENHEKIKKQSRKSSKINEKQSPLKTENTNA